MPLVRSLPRSICNIKYCRKRLPSQFVGKLREARIQNISEAAHVTLYELSPSQKAQWKIHTIPLFGVAVTANTIAEHCGETTTEETGKKGELVSGNLHSSRSLQAR